MLEGALSIHGCMDASGLPPVYAALATTPKGGEIDERNGRRRAFRVCAGLIETLQRNPLPPLWCRSECGVHRWEAASIHASVDAESAF